MSRRTRETWPCHEPCVSAVPRNWDTLYKDGLADDMAPSKNKRRVKEKTAKKKEKNERSDPNQAGTGSHRSNQPKKATRRGKQGHLRPQELIPRAIPQLKGSFKGSEAQIRPKRA